MTRNTNKKKKYQENNVEYNNDSNRNYNDNSNK